MITFNLDFNVILINVWQSIDTLFLVQKLCRFAKKL